MNESNEKYTTMEKSGSVEDLRKLRLRALLRDLVREEGRMEAAELLGVNYKTLARTIESGDLSKRMSDALERLMIAGGVPAEARQRERIDDLERGMQGLDGRVEALEKEMRSGFEKVMATVEGRAGVLREEGDRATLGSERPTTQPEVVNGGKKVGRLLLRTRRTLGPKEKNEEARPVATHRGASARRRGVLRCCLATDCRVARAQEQSPKPRKGAVMAGRGGASHGGGGGPD